jgi:hypothetical protein
MVDEVIRRMRAKGAEVSDPVVAGARTLIAQELGYEATRYVFGRSAEVRRRFADDQQIQRALSLAARAKSPQDLLSLATTQPTAAPVRNR